MSDYQRGFKGADLDSMVMVARQAVAKLCSKSVDDVLPDEDGDINCTRDSAAVFVSAESDPSALVFISYVLLEVSESPAMYALINEINADIAIGQFYYDEETSEIRYYYKYFAENPSVDLVASIISTMLESSDLYDDRLKTRLGGERFYEQADDEVDV